MCLAIPARLVSEPNDIQMVEVDILGVKRHISTLMTPAAKAGDYVLVHAGFAIQIVDEAFAAESLDMLRSMGIKHADDLAAEAEGDDTATEVPA
ncbi:MAG: HypC/HybG/HupF family hydrogenase formation chaperone [Coriobacteriia bacterium]|nr:HypC/HybG/HupF family hydrogenase formation chaperone [Coriobacteriia bacterium]